MSGAHSEAPSGRRRTLIVVKIGVSVALLSVLLSRADVAGPWAGARRAAPAWLLLALGVYLLNVLASTWRWRLLLDPQGLHLPSRTLLGSYLVAIEPALVLSLMATGLVMVFSLSGAALYVARGARGRRVA